MNIRKFYFAILTFIFISTIHTYAVKAYPYPVTVTQPDGTKLTILLKGDENKNYRTTEDGYLIQKHSSEYFHYANMDTNGKITMTSIKAKDVSKRTSADKVLLQSVSKPEELVSIITNTTIQKVKAKSKIKTAVTSEFPKTGSPKSIVILVNFSDKSYVTATPQSAFTNLLNQSGYNANGGTGSARDYFMSASYGQFSPTFDVYGPYTLTHNMAYYGANDSIGNDVLPTNLIVDACAAANNAGVDFTQYDTDNDGTLDNVFVYYAGFNEAEDVKETMPNTIWPHRWVVYTSQESSTEYTYDGTIASVTFDGKRLYDYACTSELKGNSGTSMCGIGTFCHEFGHVLGLPDYYHTNTTTDKSTLDYYSIMDAGAYLNSGCTPPTYSTYDRFFLGWYTPTEINTPSNQTLVPIYQGTTVPTNKNKQAYLISATTHNLSGSAPAPAEFFMVEYRKKTGWDAYLPTGGMFIWHIDYSQLAWDENGPNNYTGTTQTASSHMRVYLQPLSGSTTTPGAAFTTGSFTPTTWSGTNINRAITSITNLTDSFTFKLMGGQVGPTLNIAGTVNAFATYTGTATTAQSVTVTSVSLTDVVNIAVSPETNFDIKLSTDTEWKKSVTLTPASGIVNGTLNIRYNPATTGNHNATITISSTGATSKTVQLSGTAIEPENPNAPSVRAGRIDNSLTFANTKVNTTKTKTLNIKTTDVMNTLSLVITGDNAQMFSVSASSLTKEAANNLTGTNITVQYTPTVAGSHTATLTISGGGLNPAKVITLNGIGE